MALVDGAMIDPVALALDCPTVEVFEHAVLDYLSQEVGYDAAFLGLKGHLPTAIGLDPARLAHAFSAKALADELEPVQRAALASGGVAVDTEVLGSTRVQQTSYFREFAKPLGGRHSLIGLLSLRGRPLGALMLGRTGDTFSGQDQALLRQFLPKLAVARTSYGTPPAPLPPLPKSPKVRFWEHLLPSAEHTLARATIGSTEILVRDRGRFREMVARRDGHEMVWTRVDLTSPHRSGWPYVDLFHLAPALSGGRARALFIGCGAGIGPAQFARSYPGIALDVVEIEEVVVELSRAWFGLDAIPNLTVHVSEGAAFVEAAHSEQWDVVVVDAYDADQLAEPVCSARFFTSLRRILRPDGAIAFNVVGTLAGPGRVRSIVRSVQERFDDVRVVPVVTPDDGMSPHAVRNVVVLGCKCSMSSS